MLSTENEQQLKDAHKGNGCPNKWNPWPCKGNGGRRQGRTALLIVEDAFDCNGSLTALIVGACADLLKTGHQNIRAALAKKTTNSNIGQGMP